MLCRRALGVRSDAQERDLEDECLTTVVGQLPLGRVRGRLQWTAGPDRQGGPGQALCQAKKKRPLRQREPHQSVRLATLSPPSLSSASPSLHSL
jgi:hypothetical protein